MREYRFMVEKGVLHFEIIIRASRQIAAEKKAAEIGLALGILLLGPV